MILGVIGTLCILVDIVWNMVFVIYVYAHVARAMVVRYEKMLPLLPLGRSRCAPHVLLDIVVMARHADCAKQEHFQLFLYQTFVNPCNVSKENFFIASSLRLLEDGINGQVTGVKCT